MAYNDKHPKGTKFTPSELRRHRDQWFVQVSRPPWESSIAARPLPSGAPSSSVEHLWQEIRTADIWNPDILIGLAPSVLALGDDDREHLVRLLDQILAEDGDDERWNAARIVELLVELVPTRRPGRASRTDGP